MAANEQATIIIKRVKKGGHAPHHGGAWKVAYADFVTAMMAFFLLMWLLNATTEAQKQGISDYFAPSSASTSSGGAGGLLGGRAVSSPGAMTSRTAVPSISLSLEPTSGATEGNAEDEGGAGEQAKNASDMTGETTGGNREDMARSDAEESESSERKAARKKEQMHFDRFEKELLEAIDQDPELRALANHLLIEHTPEGLRIQVIDKEGRSMFALGSARMFERTQKLLGKISNIMQTLPNKIKITGHTDSIPFRGGSGGYGNWELSSDRAQSARRALVAGGLPADRVESVTGRAARDPLVPDDPTSARNRRISIMLLRDVPPPGVTSPGVRSPGVTSPGVRSRTRAASRSARPAKRGRPARLKPDWSGPRVR